MDKLSLEAFVTANPAASRCPVCVLPQAGEVNAARRADQARQGGRFRFTVPKILAWLAKEHGITTISAAQLQNHFSRRHHEEARNGGKAKG